MACTREQAYRTLAALEPAPVFLQSYQGKPLPEDLDIYFGPPEEFFLAPDTQELYTRGRLVPLLDDGNFGLVTFYDPDTRALIQLDVESPHESRTRFENWQQYLADLMIRVAESIESDERIRRIAALVGFAHTDALFEFFRRMEELPADEYEAARAQFIRSIGAGPDASADQRGAGR